jgi:hypothetical protein
MYHIDGVVHVTWFGLCDGVYTGLWNGPHAVAALGLMNDSQGRPKRSSRRLTMTWQNVVVTEL